jgi:KipI family sensor histidine kinase inhibitor
VTHVRVGEHAVRITIPSGVPRATLLAWLLDQPGVIDASLAAEHALIVFDGEPRPIVIPALDERGAVPSTEHVIEVVYDGEDLDEVAALAGITRDRLIERHSANTLEVSFLGFCPGFAYLVGLDPSLASIARRGVPRPRVPENAVAIAGGYGGIYPAAMPGGWRCLGRAIDPRLLDGETPRFAVGDRVRFSPK